MSEQTFRVKAPAIMAKLLRDFPITSEDAAAILERPPRQRLGGRGHPRCAGRRGRRILPSHLQIGRPVWPRGLWTPSALASSTINKPNVPVQNQNAAQVTREVTAAVKPIMTNATNSEPQIQSRVAIGSVGAVLGALADVATMYATGEWETHRIITDLVVLAGAAFALYGCIRGSSLKPLGQ